MEELIALLSQFNDILKKQITNYTEYLPILEEEEFAITNYDLSALEKIVIVKDQHSRISQSLEQRRVAILRKICYMIAFDPRGQKLSLNLFKITFKKYLDNIKNLVNEVTYKKILEEEENILHTATEFENLFETVYPRIYRNQIILKKLLRNITLSINLFQSEADVGMNYDNLGKAHSSANKNTVNSSMRIKA
ncbi:flagellar export chaperone FlgN [Pigmentibacter sp. JX0631]|uniref:flagellar export chaperone FlgN n=1 Tax=Pigmentibacter sp. JX0631 TaxID=2976982 RepID=UPI002469B040|nr:flagellar export chaperone FlgN [Pigmentibacter sp. JX0631]WGL60547.1 flagellar export chaperone FlgN [Pigmentibacter sp. JX0631]